MTKASPLCSIVPPVANSSSPAPRYFQWAGLTGLVGAVRPQTPHRSPRGRSGELVRGGPADRARWAGIRKGRVVHFGAMNANKLFEMALGLGSGWKVVQSEMDVESRQLKIWLDFNVGSQFACPECGEFCPVHDTVEKKWRHMDFWQHRTELIARVPRTVCPEHGVLLTGVPWAREGSGFTLMMEAVVVLLCQQMSVSAVAKHLGEHDTRIWRILSHYVKEAHEGADWSGVRRIMVDETSARKGHRYVTAIVDADSRDLLLVVEGRESQALEVFSKELIRHGGHPDQIELICMDMSPAFRKGARKAFPKARVVFDRFHIMQMAGKALDEVRKTLRRDGGDLRGGLWALRGNEWTRSAEQLELRKALCREHPKLGRAMMLRDLLQDILAGEDVESLKWWCTRAKRSRLEPFKKLADSIRDHWDGVVAFMETRVTNGLIEAINGLLQLAKRMARGFRSFKNFQTMAYLKTANLKLNLPALSPT
jgi:transposase